MVIRFNIVLEVLRYAISIPVYITAIGHVVYSVASGYSAFAFSPAVDFSVLVTVIILMGYLEGLQVALLKLQSLDFSSSQENNPRARSVYHLITTGNNLQRFLLGRQLFVIIVVFTCSQVTSFPTLECPRSFPRSLWFLIVKTGLPGTLMLVSCGSMMPQLLAARHPVGFCGLPGARTICFVALGLESLGLMHFNWIAAGAIGCSLGFESDSHNHAAGKGRLFQAMLNAVRYAVSVPMYLASIAFVLYFVEAGYSGIGGSALADLAILGCVLFLMGSLEGLQVAVLEMQAFDLDVWQDSRPRVSVVQQMLSDGDVMQRFLMGRQLCVTFFQFIFSRVASFPELTQPSGWPSALWFLLVGIGLPGALVTVSFGSLVPQVLAAREPVRCCNVLGVVCMLRITLGLQALGLTHFAWLLAAIVGNMIGIGLTAEPERKDLSELRQALSSDAIRPKRSRSGLL